jgi:ArsR family transcriptional regulator
MADLGDHLRLLADDTRLRILHLLEDEPLTVAELQEVLELGQSSISGHLAKLKTAGLIHDLAEGSARRYRPRADLDGELKASWAAVRQLSQSHPQRLSDRERARGVLARRGSDWVDRVAGSLHREYAPGRTWDSLCHGLLSFARFGRCVDVGAGDGSLVELIAPQAQSLDCIDPSAAMISAGEARTASLGYRNVHWHRASAEELPVPDGLSDSVLFLQSLQYIDHPAKALAEAARILAPGGRLLVLTLLKHDHAEAERYGHRHRGFSLAELGKWCKGLSSVHTTLLPAELRPPRFQTILLTAQKER